MDINDEPIIGVTASSLTTIIDERRCALHALKQCDHEWREERDAWRERTLAFRLGLAEVLGLPLGEQADHQLVDAVRNALAVATVHLPAGTFVLDHESARHAVQPFLDAVIEKDKRADTSPADQLHMLHVPGGPADVVMWSVSTEPWQSGDIIRYADEDGPVVDAELTMRERDEDDLTWVARIVTVHREHSTDGDQELYWEVGASLYPVENDARFTKLHDPGEPVTKVWPATPAATLTVDDDAWQVGDLIEHKTDEDHFAARLAVRMEAIGGDEGHRGWWSTIERVCDDTHGGVARVGDTLPLIEGDETNKRIERASKGEGPDTQAMPPLVIDDPWAEPADEPGPEQAADHARAPEYSIGSLEPRYVNAVHEKGNPGHVWERAGAGMWHLVDAPDSTMLTWGALVTVGPVVAVAYDGERVADHD